MYIFENSLLRSTSKLFVALGIAISVLVPITLPAAQKDESELDFALAGKASMLLTDSAGRRTGRDPASGRQLQEIPNSTYFEDSLSGEVNRSIQIARPRERQYRVAVTALESGTYQLSVRAFSRNGESQPEMLKEGNLTKKAKVAFMLTFRSTPGEESTLK